MSKVVCEVLCWGFLLDDAPRSVRQGEVGSDPVETGIESNQCYTMRQIVDILILNTVICANKKMCLLFYGKKTKQNFWSIQ